MLALSKFLNSRLVALKDWLDQNQIEGYRLYDHDLEEFAFSVDVYLDYLHIHLSKDGDDNEQYQLKIKKFFNDEFDFEFNKIFIKSRKQQKGKAQYNKLQVTKKRFIIQENERLFYINLADYFDSGLFLDHRDARKWVGQHSKNKSVLNLFAYTGAFSIYAARGGASKTVTVDTSNTYLDWAEDNFKLNKIEKGQHEFVKYDAIKYLAEARKAKSQFYDLIIIDPPTFSNSKSRQDIFEIKRDHVELINNALSILNHKGIVLFSTNFTKFKLKAELIHSKSIKDITTETIPLDFKTNPFIRYCFLIEKKDS